MKRESIIDGFTADLYTTVVTEAIKLLYYTTRAGLHPHCISSDEEDVGGEEAENQDLEEDNEANNFQLLD